MATASEGLRMALHATARVRAGNKIEITAPTLEEGQDVDVFLIPRPSEPLRIVPSLNSWIPCLRVLGVRPPGKKSNGSSSRSATRGIVDSSSLRPRLRRYSDLHLQR